ncbi:MAG TPA: insulinase family protein, partial [Kofleriaceae bacterium]|nr:insulinase family protein [Kofleriaceae bacterium]
MRPSALALLLAAACGKHGDGGAAAPATGDAGAPVPSAPAPLAGEVDRTLANGLRLVLRPVPGTGAVALVTLLRIGADADPPGRSGMAHLMEHLLVTAATSAAPARSVDDWIRRYPAGWNAQTGSDYTVVAAIFPPDRLDAELAEAAARLTDVRPQPDDLAREQPRLLAEVDNMFAWAALGAPNRARERVRPTPGGGRKGGVPEQVRAVTLDEARARLAAHYRAGNA